MTRFEKDPVVTAADTVVVTPMSEDTVAMPAVEVEAPSAESESNETVEEANEFVTTKRRSQLRKRLRCLQRSRELRLRDLGGFVYETQRTGGENSQIEELVRNKVARLLALDEEVLMLEQLLNRRRDATVLRLPGIGGSCPTCAEPFGTESRFCGNCGMPLPGKKYVASRGEQS